VAYNAKTLPQLREEVYGSGEVDDDYVVPDAMNRLVNRSFRRLYGKVVLRYPDLFVADPQVITVVSGTGEYDLSADFFRAVGVEVETESGQWRRIPRLPLSRRNIAQGASSSSLVFYRLVGTLTGRQIWLRPTPAWGGTARVLFIPLKLVDGTAGTGETSSFDFGLGWDEYIVNDCLIRACAKSASGQVQVWAALRDEALQEVLDAYHDLDANEPDQIQDVSEGLLDVFPDYY